MQTSSRAAFGDEVWGDQDCSDLRSEQNLESQRRARREGEGKPRKRRGSQIEQTKTQTVQLNLNFI